MKNKGLFTLLITAVLVIGLSYGLSKLLYAIFTPGQAKEYSILQTNTISFHNHYLAIPSGTLLERIITTFFFTLALWFIIWIFLFIVRAIRKKEESGKASSIVFYFIVILYSYSIIGSNFIPKRLTVLDPESRKLEVIDYYSILYIWPTPFVKARNSFNFDEIDSFVSEQYVENIMGAGHDEVTVGAKIGNAELPIARTMLFHGEFGWIVDWRGRTRAIEEGQEEIGKILNKLNNLLIE